MLERLKATDGNVNSALARLIEASRNLILDRIDLLRLDYNEKVAQIVQIGVLFAVAGLVLVAGWFGFLTALVLLLDGTVPRWASIGGFSLAHLVLGVLLVIRAIRLSHTESNHAHDQRDTDDTSGGQS